MAEWTFFDCHLPFIINSISHNECSAPLEIVQSVSYRHSLGFSNCKWIYMAQRWHSIFFTYSIPFPVLMHVSRDQCFNGSESWPCSAFDTGATNFHLRHPYWFLNRQSKNSKTLKGSHRIERGRNFLKISTPLFSIKIYQMRLLSARTIPLDST